MTINIETLKNDTQDNEELIKELQTNKVDLKEFDSKVESIIREADGLKKRLTLDEREIHQFAEHVVRYTPLMLQNLITENFNVTLGHKEMKKYRDK